MNAHYGLLVVAVCAVVLGLFIVAKPDAMWRFTKWRNRAGGFATGERTPTWEWSNRIVGGIVMLTGLGAAFGFWYFDQIVEEERARQERSAPSVDPAYPEAVNDR